MDPRIAMFQRKNMPMSDEGLDGGPDVLSEDSPMPEGVGMESVQCPNCQCEFDPATGEIQNAEGYETPGAGMAENLMPGDAGGEEMI